MRFGCQDSHPSVPPSPPPPGESKDSAATPRVLHGTYPGHDLLSTAGQPVYHSSRLNVSPGPRGVGVGSTGQFGSPRDEHLYNVTEKFRAYDGQAETARRQRHAEELPELAPASPGITTNRCFGRWPSGGVEFPLERTLCHAASMKGRNLCQPSDDRLVHPRQVAGAAVPQRHTPATSPDKNQGPPARSERGHRRRAPRSPWA